MAKTTRHKVTTERTRARSYVARAAILASGSGTHTDKRARRIRTRSAAMRAAITDSMA